MKTEKTIGQLIEQYLSEKDFANTTLRTYSYVLHYFFFYLAKQHRSERSPSRSDIISWKREMKARGLSTCTIDLYIVSLKGFFRWLNDAGIYDNIVSNVKIETRHRQFKKKILSPPEIKKLIESIDTTTIIGIRDKLLISLIYTCGLRRIEAHRLNLSDVDTSTGVIMIQGKGYNDKTPVSIAPETINLINDYVTERVNQGEEVINTSPLFMQHNGHMFPQRLQPDGISNRVVDCMKIAEVHQKGISVHSLRHSAAVSLIESNSSLYEVSVFLRHTNTDTSRHYTRYVEQKIAAQKRPQNILQSQIM